MKIYGNYCGPNYSGGRHIGSIRKGIRAIDSTDRSCERHDRAYARARTGKARSLADKRFVADNYGKGALRTGMALAVGLQQRIRDSTGYDLSGDLVSHPFFLKKNGQGNSFST